MATASVLLDSLRDRPRWYQHLKSDRGAVRGYVARPFQKAALRARFERDLALRGCRARPGTRKRRAVVEEYPAIVSWQGGERN
jgi:hypothetical protein